MQQRALRDRFSQKEQQLFQLHLQFNGSSRSLFEQLLRKNNEIIKLCLGSYAETAARLDEYDATLQRLDQQIGRIGDTHSNFHFEFRRTHLEAEKKHAQLVNDVSMIKNTLRIPEKEAPPEVYLSSQFFKSRATKVIPRANRDRELGRARTNFFFPQPTSKPEEAEAEAEAVSECLQSKSIQAEQGDHTISSMEAQQEQKQNKTILKTRPLPILKHAYTTMSDDACSDSASESKEAVLSKEELTLKLNEVELRLEERIREVERTRLADDNKATCKQSHFSLEQLKRHIQQQITLHLANKADTQYVEASLFNLKQAWETEEHQLCLQLEAKTQKVVFRQLVERVESLAQLIEKVRDGRALNRSMNHFTPMPSSRTGSRDNLAQSQILPRGSTKIDETRNSYKNCLSTAFSSSLAAGRRKQVNVDNLSELNETAAINQKAWKERVSELLSEGKTLKRGKQAHHH